MRCLLVEILSNVQDAPAHFNPSTTGVVGVVAYVFSELGWKVVSLDMFFVDLSASHFISFKAGSKRHFCTSWQQMSEST